MRRLAPGLFLLLWATTFAGCVEEPKSGPQQANPCWEPAPLLVGASQAVHIRPRETYRFQVHEHEQLWGKLTLIACGQGDLHVSVEESGDRVVTGQRFVFAYAYPQDGTPSDGVQLLDKWLQRPQEDRCSMTQQSPRGAEPSNSPKARAWNLVVAGDAPFETFVVHVGAPQEGKTHSVVWELAKHPGLQAVTVPRVQAPASRPAGSSFAWDHRDTPGFDSVVHVGAWTERGLDPSVGEYRDELSIRVGDKQDGYVHESRHVCSIARTQLTSHTFSFDGSDAQELRVTRRLQETSVGTGVPQTGVVVITVPVEQSPRVGSTQPS